VSDGRKAAAAAAAAVEEADNPRDTDVVELQNGIRLRVKGVPPFLIRSAVMKLVKPVPPKIKLQEGKDAEEENPDDPEYKEALAKYEEETEEAAINVMLAGGTTIEHIPDGMFGPEGDEWVDTEMAEFFGVELDLSSTIARKLSWLKYYALTSELEITVLTVALGRKVGMNEGEVADALESFRSGTMGRADNGRSSPAAGDRHQLPPSRAQRRARGGRARGG